MSATVKIKAGWELTRYSSGDVLLQNVSVETGKVLVSVIFSVKEWLLVLEASTGGYELSAAHFPSPHPANGSAALQPQEPLQPQKP